METRADQIRREDERIQAFQRKADAVARLIRDTDLPRVDIDIQIEALRREVEQLFPLREQVFDLIYRPRFERLWRQAHPLPGSENPGGTP